MYTKMSYPIPIFGQTISIGEHKNIGGFLGDPEKGRTSSNTGYYIKRVHT